MELWNAAAGGDRDAFGLLFRRYYPLLIQYGSKICPDRPSLEDTIQELFLELWNRKTERTVQSVKAYLLQALKYKIYKTFRDQKPAQSFDLLGSEPFELSHETFVIRQTENTEKLHRVLEALNSLPPRQKEIIYLKIYKGLSYEEVSQVMKINYQVVRNLLCQALKTFRKLTLADERR